MGTMKSHDNTYVSIIANILRSVQTLRPDVITPRQTRLTIKRVEDRFALEGLSFLTKTLPRLGKALDKCLAGHESFNCIGFRKIPNTKLPKLFGEFLERILDKDGVVLQDPCVYSIRCVRDLCYVFYKLETGYSQQQQDNVVSQFVKTEADIRPYHETFIKIKEMLDLYSQTYPLDPSKGNPSTTKPSPSQEGLGPLNKEVTEKAQTCIFPELNLWGHVHEFVRPASTVEVLRKARRLLAKVFARFDPYEIVPKHGPGAVASKEVLWQKFTFTNVPHRTTACYPLDAFFFASLGHICDDAAGLDAIDTSTEPLARVLLVNKDSRGPRLISCEPLALQWIQQGLGRAIMRHVELHPLTRYNVHFTDQGPNQRGAIQGSKLGRYATLDLKDASDRVTLGLVNCLFPEHVLTCLLATRSVATKLPNGEEIKLCKFAPMGSALCFPILALTVWSLLTAATEDTDAQKSILVYGDDVIVQNANALHAINVLESFGLAINHDKSCFKGFFRESCGADAYKGIVVTPVRFRTLWSSTPSPSVFTSYLAYANSLYDRGYYVAYEAIAHDLYRLYGSMPQVSKDQEKDTSVSILGLRSVPSEWRQPQARFNIHLQKMEYNLLDVTARVIKKKMNGWKMLLRYFTDGHRTDTIQLLARQLRPRSDEEGDTTEGSNRFTPITPFDASLYTKRGTVCLVRRWR